MAVSFTADWASEIADISGRPEFQNCTVKLIDPDEVEGGEYDYDTGQISPVINDGTVYEGQARFIPVRAGVPTQGEDQSNSTTLRAVRFQLPKGDGPLYIRKGMFFRFVAAPYNPSLVGRQASVSDDWQGSSSASRTVHAMMDIDSGGPS